MSKKISFKLGICLMLALLMFLPLKSSSAFAATTKNVTVTVQQSFLCTSSDSSPIQEYFTSHYTYDYDDGAYHGTLNISGVSLISQTPYPGDMIYYLFEIKYSGVVTKYPVSKYVTVVVQQSFVCTSSELGSQLSDYFSTHNSYYYNSGSYEGTLSIANISLVSQTPQSPGDIINYLFEITYSGTVTSD